MATRALAAAAAAVAAGRSVVGKGGLAVLSPSGSCHRRGGGGARSFSHSSSSSSTAERERDGHADEITSATAAQVEAALNRKNVEVVQGGRSATLRPDDAADALRGVGDHGADDAWVPDQETGVFGPADEASGDVSGNGNGNGAGARGQAAGPSVLDQAVFVREEDMEDVERPAVGGGTVDVADAGAGAE